jgi:putative NIF3 family GTP cyclohydrolase 1 type 2
MLAPRAQRRPVIAALRAAHPYEEPAFDVYEVAPPRPANTGTGRVGVLPEPQPLRRFLRQVGAALPATAAGLRSTGDPDATVETVAVCGGSGGPFVEAAWAAGADAYVTADLRHHPASEALEQNAVAGRDMALVDVAHWASEWPWLPVAASRLVDDLRRVVGPDTVEVRVSRLRTDPWTLTERSTDTHPDRSSP